MFLCTPDLPIIIDSMENLNVSLFWTGYKRMNQTHFYERSSKLYAGCGSNAWTSLMNKTWAPKTPVCQICVGISKITLLLAIQSRFRRSHIQSVMKFSTRHCGSLGWKGWDWDGKLIAGVIHTYIMHRVSVQIVSKTIKSIQI